MKDTRMNTLIQALTASISALDSRAQSQILKSANSYWHNMTKKIGHEGKKRTCAHYKSLHIVATHIAVRDTHIPLISFCKTDSEGIPLDLSPVKWLVKSESADLRRFGLTISRFYESIILPVTFDPSSITKAGPTISTSFLEAWSGFCHRWTMSIKANDIMPSIPRTWTDSLVNGPNGPALATSHYDARAVLNDPVLSNALDRLASLTGRQLVIAQMEAVGSLVQGDHYIHSRLSLLQVGGGKTRTIAMGDYWSQNVLKGIHETIMHILKGMETDGTYNQDNAFERIMRDADNSSISFDLSNATDRFPVDLQEILLSHVFSPEIAMAWRDVLTLRSFSYKGDTYRYNAGQPMGLLSSWAVFALTHHALIEFIAFREQGRLGFRKYAVLGDDVVIWDKKVASVYSAYMERFQVEINTSKSMMSDSQHRRIEFAKRIIHNNVEITGLKWDILKASSKSLYMLVSLIYVAQLRHWNLTWTGFYAPSSLSCKGKELLSVLLFAKGAQMPRFPGWHLVPPDLILERMKKEIFNQRLEAIRRKTDSINTMLRPSSDIAKLFDREGIVVPAQLISRGPVFHPVLIGLNQAATRLLSAYTQLVPFLDDEFEDEPVPEILPIEYLPIPSLKSYFGSRYDLKTRIECSIVLKAWFNIDKTSGAKASTDLQSRGGNPGMDESPV